LVTAAKNEENYIEGTILSIINQTIRPQKWIIVDDGSKDKTGDIILKYAKECKFIECVARDGDTRRNFGSQVKAINFALGMIDLAQYEYIGNIDADISIPDRYYEEAFKIFEENPKLGLLGGYLYEKVHGEWVLDKYNREYSVPHAVQLFRRKCFEDIGGYKVLKYGGPDTYAESMAKMCSWEVLCSAKIRAYHHRPLSAAEGKIKGAFRSGKMDYSLGYHPVYEILKCFNRFKEKPFALNGITRLMGYLSAFIYREKEVDKNFEKFIRDEQINRMKRMLKTGS